MPAAGISREIWQEMDVNMSEKAKRIIRRIMGKVPVLKRNQSEKLRKRLAVTLTAGLAGILLAVTVPDKIQQTVQCRQEQAAVTAWWGTLYPKFCFSRFPSEDKGKKDDIKISFWLARVINW